MRIGAWRRKRVIDRFHRLYYAEEARTWKNTYFLGVRTAKCPLDLWVYQELLVELRPDLVVEAGTAWGGSALWFACMLELAETDGRVVTIDVVEEPDRPKHERITYLTGSSTSPEIVDAVRSLASAARCVMVVLDSDHRRDHVLAELEAYAPLVTPGSYLVVEDTNVNGHPVLPRFGPGPLEAVRTFLQEHPEFEIDRSREKFLLTFNPSGFLRRRPA
jgi:cephalosporin hydroxylase